MSLLDQAHNPRRLAAHHDDSDVRSWAYPYATGLGGIPWWVQGDRLSGPLHGVERQSRPWGLGITPASGGEELHLYSRQVIDDPYGLDPSSLARRPFRGNGSQLPPVRGFPTLGVLCVRRLPNDIRRAFLVTVLRRLPVERSTSPLRFRHSPVSRFPLLCLKSRIPACDASPSQEPVGPPKFFGVSLPACRGLWTPADLHLLANPDALV
jgi:hypothetical protein